MLKFYRNSKNPSYSFEDATGKEITSTNIKTNGYDFYSDDKQTFLSLWGIGATRTLKYNVGYQDQGERKAETFTSLKEAKEFFLSKI